MSFTLQGTISKDEIRDLFIPEVENALVASNMVTMETILDAESIKIPGVGNVDVADYTGTATVTDATDTSVTLALNKAKYFMKSIDKIDNEQAAIKIISKVVEKGAFNTADAIDASIFDTLAGVSNTIPAVTALDQTNVVKMISDLSVKLTNQKAPRRGRRLAVSPEVAAVISSANLNFNTTSAEEASREGFVGRFGGFDIFETINLKENAGKDGVMVVAGVPDGAYAGIGFQEYGVAEPDESFKWIAKGLANFGSIIAQEAMYVTVDCKIK